jgi:hypothetical protein
MTEEASLMSLILILWWVSGDFGSHWYFQIPLNSNWFIP